MTDSPLIRRAAQAARQRGQSRRLGRVSLFGRLGLLIALSLCVDTVWAEPNEKLTPLSSAEIAKPDKHQASLTIIHPAPSETHTLRAIFELQSVFLLGWVYYLTTADLPDTLSLDYRWDVFKRKITGRSFSTDTNHFGTNFVGHPLGGAGYYISARSNGMSVLASSTVSFLGSALWELFGEIREEVSMNDTITTPLAGISIGETTYQLGRFFDRGSLTWYNQILGALLGPFTTLNNTLDGTHESRVDRGYAHDGWHRLELESGFSQVRQMRDRDRLHPEFFVRAEARAERLPLPTRATPVRYSAFYDGNVARITVELGMSRARVSNVRVETETVLAGVHYASARDRLHAESGYLGLGMGFTYTARAYDRALDAPLNRVSAVRPLALTSGHHVRRGGFLLDAWAAFGPSFGGIDALALSSTFQRQAELPSITRNHGYYFGLGSFTQAGIDVKHEYFSVGASALGEAFRAVRAPGQPPVAKILDEHQHLQGYVGYPIPDSANEIRLFSSMRRRSGSLVDNRIAHREVVTGLSLILRPKAQP